MNQAKVPSLIRNPNPSIEQIECENQWYSSVFGFLKSIETTQLENFRDLSLNPLFETTHRYLNHILRFQNAAFYSVEAQQENIFTLQYW